MRMKVRQSLVETVCKRFREEPRKLKQALQPEFREGRRNFRQEEVLCGTSLTQ